MNSYSYQGLVFIDRNIGESSNSYFNRVKYIKDEISKLETITPLFLNNLDSISKKKVSEELLGCKYISSLNYS